MGNRCRSPTSLNNGDRAQWLALAATGQRRLVRFGARDGSSARSLTTAPCSVLHSSQTKAARRRLLNSILMMDQTNLNAGFDLRRYAMKPTPAKPRTIMAHVEGSGTAGETVAVQAPGVLKGVEIVSV